MKTKVVSVLAFCFLLSVLIAPIFADKEKDASKRRAGGPTTRQVQVKP